MCCDNYDDYDLEEESCPECGRTAEDTSCGYSPVVCEHCGWAPCDQSC